MKKINIYFVSTIVFYLLSPQLAIGQERVSVENIPLNVNDKSLSPSGIFYALPKNYLLIEIDIVREETKPPGNKDLCNELFGDCKAILGQDPFKKGIKFTIENLKVNTLAIADLEHVYRVDARKKWNKKKSINISLSPNGLIQGSTVQEEDVTFELITSVVSAIGTLARNVGDLKVKTDEKDIEECQKKSGKRLSKEELRKCEEAKEKAQRNDRMAGRIFDLIIKRENLISSPNYGSDKETLEYQISEFNKLIGSQIGIVLGTKKRKTKTLKFIVSNFPKDYNSSTETLFTLINGNNMDLNEGVVLSDGYKDSNYIPEKFKGEASNSGSGKKDDFKVVIKPKKTGIASHIKGKLKQDSGEAKGMPYRIPGIVDIKIFHGKEKEIYRGDFQIAQLGEVAHLPNKMDSAEIQYYLNTGALQTVNVSSNPLPADKIDSLNSAFSTTRDAIRGQSEIERLTEEIELINLRNQLKELRGNQ